MEYDTARIANALKPSEGPGPSGFANSARKQVRHILSGSQYQSRPEKSFHPLSGVLAAIGRWFERVFGPPWRWVIHHLFHPVGHWLSADLGIPWPIVVLVIALLAGVAAGVILIRRRPRIDIETARRARGFASEDPQELEDLARRAELAGDMRTAIRLRFRAGVARLDRLGVINRGSTRTTRELSGILHSAEFDVLAADLEAIVYGGAPATGEQAAEARSGWRTVTLEAARKIEAEAGASGGVP